MTRSYFDNLAGIRGYAAAVVLFSHLCQLHFLRFTGLNSPLHGVSSITSEYAVVVFFILSGYLISHTLSMNLELNGKLRLDVYIAARIARIYPPFLYAICVSLTVFFVMHIFGLPGRSVPMSLPGETYAARDIVHLTLRDLIQSLFMLQGLLEINGPLWSLYIEAKLYVLFACAQALSGGGRGTLHKLGLALIIATVLMAGIYFNPGFARYAAFWLIGAATYYQLQPEKNHYRWLFCVVLILTAQAWHVVKDGGGLWFAVRDVFVGVLISYLLFRLKVRFPGARRLANYSYSLYATHFPVLLLVQSLLIYTGSVGVTAALAAAVVSVLSAFIVALIGGAIEGRKPAIERCIFALITRRQKTDTVSSHVI